jgi:hypothetical protein
MSDNKKLADNETETGIVLFFLFQKGSWKLFSPKRDLGAKDLAGNGSGEILHADIVGLIRGNRYKLCSPNFHSIPLRDDGTMDFSSAFESGNLQLGVDMPGPVTPLRAQLVRRRYNGKASWVPPPAAFNALIASADIAVRAKILGKRVRGISSWRPSPNQARNIESVAILDGVAV